MNIAHLAFYANQVLENLKSVEIETLPVRFWQGLYEGTGDIESVPDFLIEEPDIDDSIEGAFIEIDLPYDPHA